MDAPRASIVRAKALRSERLAVLRSLEEQANVSEHRIPGGPFTVTARAFAYATPLQLVGLAALIVLAACLPAAASSTVATLSTRSNLVPLAHRSAIPFGISDKRCASYPGERLYAGYYSEGLKSYDVLALPADAKTDVTPLCDITYDGINLMGGLAVDASGKLWVSDSGKTALYAFPHAQNGSGPPVQVIQGSKTLLIGLPGQGAQEVSADASGNIWVPCWWGYNGTTGYVVAFKNDANGNVAPLFTIGYASKDVPAPVATAFDHEGNLYVAEYSIPGKVYVFSPPFKDTSYPVATWTVPYLANYLAVDQYDNVYVGNTGFYYVFKHGLKSKGVIWRSVDMELGAYGIAVAPNGRVYDSLLTWDPDHQIAIGVLPPRATSFSQERFITSPDFTNGPLTSLAVGL
jgi:hypothetical protein